MECEQDFGIAFSTERRIPTGCKPEILCEHHKQTDFITEYRKLLEEHGVAIDDRYFP